MHRKRSVCTKYAAKNRHTFHDRCEQNKNVPPDFAHFLRGVQLGCVWRFKSLFSVVFTVECLPVLVHSENTGAQTYALFVTVTSRAFANLKLRYLSFYWELSAQIEQGEKYEYKVCFSTTKTTFQLKKYFVNFLLTSCETACLGSTHSCISIHASPLWGSL